MNRQYLYQQHTMSGVGTISWFLSRRDLLSEAKVAITTILGNEKRNVLEAH